RVSQRLDVRARGGTLNSEMRFSSKLERVTASVCVMIRGEPAIRAHLSRHKLHMRVVGVKRALHLSPLVSGPALSFFSTQINWLTDVALWSCGRRTSVVQAQRQIHRVLAPYTVGGQRTRFAIEIAALR